MQDLTKKFQRSPFDFVLDKLWQNYLHSINDYVHVRGQYLAALVVMFCLIASGVEATLTSYIIS